MKNITYQEIKETLNHETGEIIESRRFQRGTFEDEPNYIKLYLKDICILKNIQKSGNDTLNELLTITNYQNEIVLNSSIKKRICEKLNIKIASLNNNISHLTKEEILLRTERGIYMLNPNIFGKGKWQDIKELRITWKYSEKGRELEKIERKDTKQLEMNFEKSA